MMNYICISQDLTPKVQVIENKTHYCFTIKQSREIAKLLEGSIYNDSLVHSLSQNVSRYKLITQQKDSINFIQYLQLKNYALISENSTKSILELEENAKDNLKVIKKVKRHKWLLGVCIVVLSTLVIVK